MTEIVEATTRVLGIEQEALRSESRKARIVRARQICTLLGREQEYTFDAIGQALGRNHSVAIYTQKAALRLMKSSDYFRKQVELVKFQVDRPVESTGVARCCQ